MKYIDKEKQTNSTIEQAKRLHQREVAREGLRAAEKQFDELWRQGVRDSAVLGTYKKMASLYRKLIDELTKRIDNG